MNDQEETACPRCGQWADDVWPVTRNGKPERMCPGCVATCRIRGDEVRT